MAKQRSRHKRPPGRTPRTSSAEGQDDQRATPSPFSLKPEPVSEERREILEQIPLWARTLRVRSGLAIVVVALGALVAYNAGGRLIGPAAAGFLMVGAGLAMWRADKLERRARERMEGGG